MRLYNNPNPRPKWRLHGFDTTVPKEIERSTVKRGRWYRIEELNFGGEVRLICYDEGTIEIFERYPTLSLARTCAKAWMQETKEDKEE